MRLSIKTMAMLCPVFLNMLPSLHAMDSAKVLPGGVRNVNVKNVQTTVSQTSDARGSVQALGAPFEKAYTFQKAVDAETNAIKRQMMLGLLGNYAIATDDTLVEMHADVVSKVQIHALIASYGITDRLTLALAVPYYQARVAQSLGAHPTEKAQLLIDSLDANHNDKAAAKAMSQKLNHFLDAMNDKLRANGYAAIGDWQGSGIGDVVLGAKYQYLDSSYLRVASSHGFSFPTGRVDDPDNLLDVEFGTGSLGLFNAVLADQPVGQGFFFNEYFKYTHYFPSAKRMRLIRDDERVDGIQADKVGFQLGDQIEIGTSLQYEADFGLVMGLGYSYSQKFADTYYVTLNEASKAALESGTNIVSPYIETKIGYSSLSAFQRKEIAVPFTIGLEYRKNVATRNAKIKDIVLLDSNIYF